MTANQISNLDFSNNLLLNELNEPDKSQLVYDYSNGYSVVDFMVNKVSKARRIDGLDGIFQKPIMGISQVIAQVASTTLISTKKLRVNFVDTTYDLFRLTETVSDGTANNNMGRVIDHQAGYIVLEVAPPLTAWDTTRHFLAGTYATVLFQSSANRGSVGMESLYEYPQYVKNQTSITRGSVELFRRDMSKTWATFQGDYWGSAQDKIVMQRYARELEFRALWSNYGKISNSSLGGDVNYSMGLKAAIQDANRGGVFKQLVSPMNQETWENFLGEVADKQSAQHTELTIILGRGALRQIQGFVAPYIQFGGSENTFGADKIFGIDSYFWASNGIKANLIMAPALNDRTRFPQQTLVQGLSGTRLQYTVIALDMHDYEAVGGGSLPAMEKVYFGEKEVYYEYLNGIAMGNNFMKGAGATSGSVVPVTDRDATSFQLYSDCAYDFMANRMGWLELAI